VFKKLIYLLFLEMRERGERECERERGGGEMLGRNWTNKI